MKMTTRLLVLTTSDPSSGFEENTGVGSGFCVEKADFNHSVNLGTNCKSQPNGNRIWHCCKPCQVGSGNLVCSFNSVAFYSLAFCIHSIAYFRVAPWASHSAAFPFDRVVTCCPSMTSTVTMFIVGCFSLDLTGHWLLTIVAVHFLDITRFPFFVLPGWIPELIRLVRPSFQTGCQICWRSRIPDPDDGVDGEVNPEHHICRLDLS